MSRAAMPHANYGIRLAAKVFALRARGNGRRVEIHIGETELAALLAIAHQAGAELGSQVATEVAGAEVGGYDDALASALIPINVLELHDAVDDPAHILARATISAHAAHVEPRRSAAAKRRDAKRRELVAELDARDRASTLAMKRRAPAAKRARKRS